MLLGLGGANRPLKFFCLSITVRSLLGADVLFTLSHFFCVCPVVIVVRKDFYRLIWFKEMQCDDGSCIIETQAFECCEVIHMSYVHMSSSMHSLSLSLSIYLSISLFISLSIYLSPNSLCLISHSFPLGVSSLNDSWISQQEKMQQMQTRWKCKSQPCDSIPPIIQNKEA